MPDADADADADDRTCRRCAHWQPCRGSDNRGHCECGYAGDAPRGISHGGCYVSDTTGRVVTAAGATCDCWHRRRERAASAVPLAGSSPAGGFSA